MILIPAANIDAYRASHTPEQWMAWLAILQEHGTETPDGWKVPWEKYNAVSAARKTGVFDLVAHPPPSPPAEPAASPRPVAAQGGAQSPPQPIDPAEWPAWAKLVRLAAKPGDKGIGDTMHREAGVIGQTWEALYLRLTGHPCGCGGRVEALNQQYPYTS